MEPVLIKPIGIVRNDAGRRPFDGWREVVSELVIEPRYQEALYRLDDYSHIYVIFHLNEVEGPFKHRIHPTGNPEYPLVGAFATRTPNRPSRIGLTICWLLKVEGNLLTVKGLDAYDGSSVLDVKPYFPNVIEGARVPGWNMRLHKELEKRARKYR